MNLSRGERIWFNPPRFWAATKNMEPSQVEQLMNEVFQLAEKRDIEQLKRYDFISVDGQARRNPFQH